MKVLFLRRRKKKIIILLIYLILIIFFTSCDHSPNDPVVVNVYIVGPKPELTPTSATPVSTAKVTPSPIYVEWTIVNVKCSDRQAVVYQIELLTSGGVPPYRLEVRGESISNNQFTVLPGIKETIIVKSSTEDGEPSMSLDIVVPSTNNCQYTLPTVRPVEPPNIRLELCNNGKDDNGDSKVDEPGCYVPEICFNRIDDDGDGKIDSADLDCPQPPKVEICGNGIDDDGDGKVDGADLDCPPDPPFRGQCRDGKDNDGDGLIDYPADPQCRNPIDDNEGD